MENLTDKQIEKCITKAIDKKNCFDSFDPFAESLLVFVIERTKINKEDISYMEYLHFKEIYKKITKSY
jgi:hypothetical protein